MRLVHLSNYAIIACAILLAWTPLPSCAKDVAKDATKKMQLQLRQVMSEKAALEQSKAALDQEVETLRKKTADSESSIARSNRARQAAEKEVETLKHDKTALTEKVAVLEKQLGETGGKLGVTDANLRQVSDQKQRLEQDLAFRGKELSSCEAKNMALYRYQVEMISQAQNRGTLSALLEHEPMVGFGRVQVENLLEEYRDKIDKEQIVGRDQ
jgi:chromosome segregation ATPase